MEEKDKVTQVVVTDKTMIMTLKDGKKVPVGAKVTETFYESGRKDCHIKLNQTIGG
jgi:uncharacterized protein (UPF0179 family)